MAIAAPRNTADAPVSSFKTFVGIMPVSIIAVNPSSEELSEIYGREMKAPDYVFETENEIPNSSIKNKVKSARIDFIIKNEEFDFLSKITFFLTDNPWVSGSGKCQVIDKYGNTAWVTQEQYKNKDIPMYANGPARIDKQYRPAYRNEETIVILLRQYYGIPKSHKWVNETRSFVLNEDLDSCIIQLDNIKDYFDGDFSELKKIIKMSNSNKVKVLLGARVVDGKTHQDVFTRYFMSNLSNSTTRIKNEVKSAQEGGGYSNTIFNHFGEPVEYNASQASSETSSSSPFGDSDNPFGSTPTNDVKSPF